MLLRRTLPIVVAAIALTGCPSVDRDGEPERIAVATFDPATSTIPLPNDLALQRAPGLPDAAGVQKQLLLSFLSNGGFPSDQEVAITIPIAVKTRQADGSYGAPSAPADLDLTTVSDANVALFNIAQNPAVRIQRCTANPPATACFEPSYANGTLSLRRLNPDGSRRWDVGGRYVVALRSGIRTADGLVIGADQAIALIAPNRSLAAPEFQPPGGLPPATLAQLESLRGLYATGRFWTPSTDLATCTAAGVPATPCWVPVPAGASGTPALPAAFDVVSTVFPTDEIAVLQTFTVQGSTFVRPVTDSGSGQVPLPSDFLLDPATGKVRNIAAFGPAAQGLATLDGFSTTAPLLIPLTGPVKAETITPSTARIFEVTSTGLVPVVGLSVLPGAPAPAGPPQVLVQPPTAISNGVATSIVLAPAVPIDAAT
ncbi:MAG TPA: hypothetical protein VFK85_05290, partial [Anaeromyxobacteraceae bacterium]|nr:hypothetical protein [Anaeromyxobacteraceae bacterium]